jgi:hypothetical protein
MSDFAISSVMGIPLSDFHVLRDLYDIYERRTCLSVTAATDSAVVELETCGGLRTSAGFALRPTALSIFFVSLTFALGI